ncbi:MAG: hypothetical protein IJ842_02905 [Bacilli bacterium]|nr:hypothetical protein [Bacilli bacterium]
MSNLPLGADNSSAPFNRKEININLISSRTEYREYTIQVWEDEWEDMSYEERTRYVVNELNHLKVDENEVLEDFCEDYKN